MLELVGTPKTPMAALYRTCRAGGMNMLDILEILLDEGRVPFSAVLDAIHEPEECLELALTGIGYGISDPLATVQALAAKGVHPLTVATAFFQERRGRLLAKHRGIWSDTRKPMTIRSTRPGFMISGYRPPSWLSSDPMAFWVRAHGDHPPSLTLLNCDLDGLEVGGTLRELHLNQCRGKARLTGDVLDHLSVLDSTGKLALPEKLGAAFLELRDCARLDSLPRSLDARRVLIERCPNLETAPEHWPLLERLTMVGTSMRSILLPAGMKMVMLARLPELRAISIQAGVQLDLHLDSLPALESLQAPRTLLGNVFINRCELLEDLPHDIAHCQNLTLMHLPNLDGPPCVPVEGRMRIIECRRIPESRSEPMQAINPEPYWNLCTLGRPPRSDRLRNG